METVCRGTPGTLDEQQAPRTFAGYAVFVVCACEDVKNIGVDPAFDRFPLFSWNILESAGAKKHRVVSCLEVHQKNHQRSGMRAWS